MKNLVSDTLKVIDEMFFNNEKVTFASVCKKADVSRKFLYNHQEIVDKIKFYRDYNAFSIDDKITFMKKENESMKSQLIVYEKNIIDSILENKGSD